MVQPSDGSASASDSSSSAATHKFAVGQKVRFSPVMSQAANPGELFVVVRQLPESGGVFQYEIKSEIDGHSRVVRETQLADL
jgi:hypothetical protein